MLKLRQFSPVHVANHLTNLVRACILHGTAATLFFVIIVLLVSVANAGPIRQINFSQSSLYFPFSLRYDDQDGNGLLSASEVVQLDPLIPRPGTTGVLDRLLSAANVPGISIGSDWTFANSVPTSRTFGPSFFTYADFVVVAPALFLGKGRLTATSALPGGFGDFAVDFQDFDHDTLLSPDEIFAFSGVTIGRTFYDTIRAVPSKIGATDGGGIAWRFTHSAATRSVTTVYANWTYDIDARDGLVYNIGDPQQGFDPTPPAVPAPATLPLLALGLGALGLAALRQRSGVKARTAAGWRLKG
jgi:hypothetical protein